MLFTLSIVSHGHGQSVGVLIDDLNAYSGTCKLSIVLTLNVPRLEAVFIEKLSNSSIWPIRIIKNICPTGFSENHNAAFKHAEPGIWCMVNPDIRLPSAQLDALVSVLAHEQTGLAFPKQMSCSGEALEYLRDLVTPWSLTKRYLGGLSERPAQPDWVSGCFMAFRSEVFQALGGFDQRYFLYCEDVDICLRMQLTGYKMVEADFSIIHDTRRGTLKKFQHLKWHVGSLVRLWCSCSFWAYLWNRSKIRAR